MSYIVSKKAYFLFSRDAKFNCSCLIRCRRLRSAAAFFARRCLRISDSDFGVNPGGSFGLQTHRQQELYMYQEGCKRRFRLSKSTRACWHLTEPTSTAHHHVHFVAFASSPARTTAFVRRLAASSRPFRQQVYIAPKCSDQPML